MNKCYVLRVGASGVEYPVVIIGNQCSTLIQLIFFNLLLALRSGLKLPSRHYVVAKNCAGARMHYKYSESA
jgi:hypothetical protein